MWQEEPRQKQTEVRNMGSGQPSHKNPAGLPWPFEAARAYEERGRSIAMVVRSRNMESHSL